MDKPLYRVARIVNEQTRVGQGGSAPAPGAIAKIIGQNLFVGILAISLVIGVYQLQAQAHSPKVSKEDVRKLEQAWADAVFKGDVEALEKLLADNINYIHGTGLVETKAQFIEQLRSGNRKFLAPIVPEEINVRTFGDTAIVTGKFTLKVLSRGKEITGVNRFTHVFAKVGKEWQLVAHHATLLPAEK
ncbi:MAG: DUF3225 domain-containing protein [Deltaproteobacteria bacterium]|nr:DUF3225 domain-containing protein [Deltaproteobacteria bacterium]